MNDVSVLLEKLLAKGWTISAVADAIEVPRNTVDRWRRGVHQPAHEQAVALLLERLLLRKRIPPRKRYVKVAHPKGSEPRMPAPTVPIPPPRLNNPPPIFLGSSADAFI